MEDQIFVSAKFRRRLLDFPPIPMNKPCSFVIQYASSSQLLWLQRKTDANWNGCEKTGCSQSISLLNTAATADEYQLFITFSTQLVLISFLIFLIFQLFDCFLSSVVLAVASSLAIRCRNHLKWLIAGLRMRLNGKLDQLVHNPPKKKRRDDISWNSAAIEILAWENPLEILKNDFGSLRNSQSFPTTNFVVRSDEKMMQQVQHTDIRSDMEYKSSKWSWTNLLFAVFWPFDVTFLLNVKWINTAKWLDLGHCCSVARPFLNKCHQ